MRTPCCDKSGLKKGTWTTEEDRKLIAYVTRYGCWNWRQLPKFAGLSRCGKSCRLRWMNYLRPNVKRGNYTKEEEESIIRLHESMGNKWSAIAAHLPGRTDNEIKNYWHTNLKKRSNQKTAMVRLNDEAAKTNNLETNGEEKSRQNDDGFENSASVEILESSSFSSEQESGMELASSSVTAAETSSDMIRQDQELAFWEECSGNFWTEPFVPDNFYDHSNDHLASLVETAGGFISPYLDQDILCPYAFY